MSSVAELDTVLARLASMPDEKLDPVLAKLLPRLLDPKMVGSPDAPLRTKVIQILTHINKRVKASPRMQLPAAALLDVFAEHKNPKAIENNFIIMYLDFGVPRLAPEAKAPLLGKLMRQIASRPAAQQQTLCRLLLNVAPHFALPAGAEARAEALQYFAQHAADLAYVRDFFMDVLLYFPAAAPATPRGPESPLQAAAASQNSLRQAAAALQRGGPQGLAQLGGAQAAPAPAPAEEGPPRPPGLSPDKVKRVEGKAAPAPEELTAWKRAVLHAIKAFQGTDALSNAQLLPLLLAGTCDFNDGVCRAADDQLRALDVDMEDTGVLKALMTLVTGTPKHLLASTHVDQRIAPTRVSLRARAMQKLLMSVAAANVFPGNLECIIGCVFHTQPGETGESLMRVRVLGMEFTRWVLKHASDKMLQPIASMLHTNMLKIITEGVSVPLENESATPRGGSGTLVNTVRGLAFHALSELAARRPSLVNGDASVVRLFFKILGNEEEDAIVRSYVREALTALITVYLQAPADVLAAIEELLGETFLRTGDSNTRFTVVYWTNQLFPFSHVPSRQINLMAVGDSQDDVAEEARHGLTPGHHVSQGGLRASAPLGPGRGGLPGAKVVPAHPSFADMALNLVNHEPGLLGTGDSEHLPFQPVVCMAMISFLRACLASDCKGASVNVSTHLLQLIDGAPDALDAYEGLLRNMFVSSASSELQRSVSLALDEYLTALPGDCPRRAAFADPAVASWLRRWVLHTTDEPTQEALALALGASAHGADDATADRLADGLLKVSANASEGIGERYGATVAVGVLLSQTINKESAGKDRFLLSPERRETLAAGLFKCVSTEKHEAVRRALCLALGRAGEVDPLPLALGEFASDAADPPADGAAPEPVEAETAPTRHGVISAVVSILEDPKAKGKLASLAASALGQMCVGDRSEEAVRMCQAALLRTPTTMQQVGDRGFEDQFVVGKALVRVAAGMDRMLEAESDGGSSAAMDTDPSTVEADTTEDVLKTVFDRLTSMDNPRERGAACVWLFCFVDFLGSHPAVRTRLIDAQKVFMMCLGDRSDLIQEVASRGVAVVYDRSDADTRSTLVKSLVGGLSSEKQGLKPTGVDGSADREVFGVDSSALGKAPDGSGTSTYKELCSLVNDMGQPDLIYKFMGLAAHGQMLNNQAGLSLGLGSIASKAQAELAPHLPTLIPKLFRYQFDPTPKVQQSMRSMWAALVDDTKIATEEHFEAIVNELLPSMGERQWRVREASSAALADIISGRPPAVVRPFLAEMWRMVLRAMDDIKETVRTAADRAGRTLASISIKLCDHGNASPTDGPKDCEVVIPYLMKQGLNADADEVRTFAIKTLIKVAKEAGPWLGPHIPAIAPAMLESLSLMEPAMLNYAQFHVEDKETLESMRAAASATGPCSEVLDLCIKYADDKVVKALAPRLSQLARSAVGLPSRVGVGRFIVSLCNAHAAEVAPSATKIVDALVQVIRVEMSVPVQRSYSSALAACCRLCKPGVILKVIDELMDHYQEARAAAARRTVAIAVRDLQTMSGDAAAEAIPRLLPVAYMGRRDADASLAAVWERVWDDGATAGEAAALAAHVEPILGMATGLLLNPTYVLRAQGAAAVAAVAKAATAKAGGGSPPVSIPPATLRRTVAALVAALEGRLWDGKEALLHALAALAKPLAALTPEDLAMEIEVEAPSRKRSRPTPAESAVSAAGEAQTLDAGGDSSGAMDLDEREEESSTGRRVLEPCSVAELAELALKQCARPKAAFRQHAIQAVAEIYPALDAQTSATILPSTLAVVEIAVAGERGGGVDDDDEEEDDPSAMQYDEDGEVMAARRRRQRQRDEYAAQALSMLLKCWPDKKGEASDEGAGEIIWPALASESAAAGELALGEKYVSLLSAAMSRPAVNVRCAALAALEEWTERASTAVLASQMAAVLPCVQTGAPVTHSLQ